VGEAVRVSAEARPAFYALERGGWRDYVTLLHLPYTAWNVAYAGIGAGLATHVDWRRAALTLLAFFLAVGIGAHALDELKGHPLRTAIPDPVLVVGAAASIAGACVLGVVVALAELPWLLLFIAAGAFLVSAYNLELAGGRFHGDWWFAASWGGFPVLVGAFAQQERVSAAAVLAALGATLMSLAQRRLSTFVRTLRRNVDAIATEVTYNDGRATTMERTELIAPAEAALRLLTGTAVLLALALLASHL
jgi:hypothetical protein